MEGANCSREEWRAAPRCAGGKLHGHCKCPSMVLEESEKEGKPVFSSMHGRTGEAGRGRRGSTSLISAF